jgi:hypothetical protein
MSSKRESDKLIKKQEIVQYRVRVNKKTYLKERENAYGMGVLEDKNYLYRGDGGSGFLGRFKVLGWSEMKKIIK